MNIRDEYLSDEELEQLILEVEENELVSAPPEFMEHVLQKTEEWWILQRISQEDVNLEGEKQGTVYKEAVKQESVYKEAVKQESVSKEAVKQETVSKENVKQEKAEQESVEQAATKQENKVIEFHKYCIRVITSAAAAIAILFALPNAEPVEIRQVPTRQERIGICVTREELLDDTGFLTKLMNGLNIRIGGFIDETEKEK